MSHGTGHVGDIQTGALYRVACRGQHAVDRGGAIGADIRPPAFAFGKDTAIGGGNSGAATGAASVNADQERRVYLCHPNCLGHLFWRGKTIFAIRFTHGRNGFANGTCA